MAGIREALVAAHVQLPATRVLAESVNRIEQAVAVPGSREATARYVADVVEQLKAGGFVRAALDRHGQAGARVASPAQRSR